MREALSSTKTLMKSKNIWILLTLQRELAADREAQKTLTWVKYAAKRNTTNQIMNSDPKASKHRLAQDALFPKTPEASKDAQIRTKNLLLPQTMVHIPGVGRNVAKPIPKQLGLRIRPKMTMHINLIMTNITTMRTITLRPMAKKMFITTPRIITDKKIQLPSSKLMMIRLPNNFIGTGKRRNPKAHKWPREIVIKTKKFTPHKWSLSSTIKIKTQRHLSTTKSRKTTARKCQLNLTAL
jgi:hypothetical protein